MLGFLFSFLLLKTSIYIINSKDFWALDTRASFLLNFVFKTLKKSLSSKVLSLPFVLFLGYLIFSNLLRRIPLNAVPRIHYCFTASIRLILWVSMVGCILKTQVQSFMSHMLPYGSPFALIFLLPIVEVFSHLIRPLTLIVRLRTNLSSGHILLYIFSYFTLLRGSHLIYTALFILILLEYCVVVIQSYIFVSLISMYLTETY